MLQDFQSESNDFETLCNKGLNFQNCYCYLCFQNSFILFDLIDFLSNFIQFCSFTFASPYLVQLQALQSFTKYLKQTLVFM